MLLYLSSNALGTICYHTEDINPLTRCWSRQQDQTQRQLDQLVGQQVTTQEYLDQLAASFDRLAQRQDLTQTQLNALALKVDRMSDRVDAFVFTAQHYFTQHSERIAKLEGIAERLEGILAYLVRKDDRGESGQLPRL